MIRQWSKGITLKTILAIAWTLFTVAMITWWWIYGLRLANELSHLDLGMAKGYRMLLWEGGSLLVTVTIGGMALIYYVYRDSARNERLRVFFANFSHDIKTSIARLRLQSEVLMEDSSFSMNPVLKRLVQDIQRLDLQLENSLLLSRPENSRLFLEDLSLVEIIGLVKSEFPEIELSISQQAHVFADRRALLSIVRNILSNSVHHGNAGRIDVKVGQSQTEGKSSLRIEFKDNGRGSSLNASLLNQSVHPLATTAEDHDSHANRRVAKGQGVGLFLATQLMAQMKGSVEVASLPGSGFSVILNLPGNLPGNIPSNMSAINKGERNV